MPAPGSVGGDSGQLLPAGPTMPLNIIGRLLGHAPRCHADDDAVRV
jgi:hypothetical protein